MKFFNYFKLLGVVHLAHIVKENDPLTWIFNECCKSAQMAVILSKNVFWFYVCLSEKKTFCKLKMFLNYFKFEGGVDMA